jgi:hypothetical protein
MYAFFVKSHWINYLNNNPTKSPNSIADTMEFLSVVGTPCILDTNAALGVRQFNGVEGFFAQVSNGAAIKFDASLAKESNIENTLRNMVIA